jgi:hypothetical protein
MKIMMFDSLDEDRARQLAGCNVTDDSGKPVGTVDGLWMDSSSRRVELSYCDGVTTVVVVEVGGATGSVTVVVRLTVVVVVVGGGVVTTSSLEQATRQTPTAISGRRRHRVCISVRCFVCAPNDGLLYFGQESFSCHSKVRGCLRFGLCFDVRMAGDAGKFPGNMMGIQVLHENKRQAGLDPQIP